MIQIKQIILYQEVSKRNQKIVSCKSFSDADTTLSDWYRDSFNLIDEKPVTVMITYRDGTEFSMNIFIGQDLYINNDNEETNIKPLSVYFRELLSGYFAGDDAEVAKIKERYPYQKRKFWHIATNCQTSDAINEKNIVIKKVPHLNSNEQE